MNDKIKQGYLYDFYGELLNVHQRTIYEDFVLNDLSLGEIATEQGISRQAVHDNIRRTTNTLQGYEDKLHLIEKFVNIRQKVEQIDSLVRQDPLQNVEDTLSSISKISDQILEEL
ncbi:MAG: DNA-binding protein [Lachnospiraceae bacterium]|nr:DNA-binding protein [Lachnospiraceae bacterium]